MIELNEIKEYVQKTAEIISSVLDMQIIISDTNRNLLGDSYPEWNIDGKLLSDTSILTKVMKEGNNIILDSKNKHEWCHTCKNWSSCNISTVVGVPIKYCNNVIGSIGVLADSYESEKKLLSKTDYFLDFINQMSEQLISKLVEREKNIQLRIMHERLKSTIDSMDSGIISVDDKGNVVYCNAHVYEFIDEKFINDANTPVYKLIEKQYIKNLILNNENFKNKEIMFKRKTNSICALISGKSITVENDNVGAVLSIKKLSDVYNEVNEISTSNTSMSFDDIIGESEELLMSKKKAAIIANSTSTVLIQGESGTGKELFARAIHSCSNISDKPFIAINCAAIPDNLLESELFGYESGAFTGASKGGKIGKFQLADGGTIFLDEIGEMPIHLQPKLLRVLQERQIEKIGGKEIIPINIRVIAATNKDLEEMIKLGEFREDLYYRLNVIPILIPPLNQRKGDIVLLLNFFLNVYNKKLCKNVKGFTQDVEEVLINYKWKGNVRELQNLVEYAVNLANGEYITLKDIPIRLNKENLEKKEQNFHLLTIDEITKKQIADALKHYGTDLEGKAMAANVLGMSRATLYRKIKQYKIY